MGPHRTRFLAPLPLAWVAAPLLLLAAACSSGTPVDPGGNGGAVDAGTPPADAGASACAADQKLCNGACVAAGPDNGCGMALACDACTPPEGGSAACVSSYPSQPSSCTAACPDGSKACDGSCVATTPANGCSAQGCAACALQNVAPENQRCSSGGCDYAACDYGFEDLDGNRANGCEAAFCPLFDKRCPSLACHTQDDPSVGCSDPGCRPCDSTNGVARCAPGAQMFEYKCDLDCANLHKKCDGRCVPATDPQWGCASDSCTPCALANVTGAYCSLFTAACDYQACAEGWEDRDGVRSNGCEALAGCFAGQKTCGSTQRCMNDPGYGCSDAACTPCSWPSSLQGQPACLSTGDTYTCGLRCNAGYKSCGGDCVAATPAVGCNMSGCNPCTARLQNVLVSTIVCGGAGGCDYGQCQAGFEDLDGDRANGCETRNPKTVKLAALQLWVRGDVGLEPTDSGIRWRDQSGRGNDLIGQWGEHCTKDPETGEFLCNRMGPPAIAENFNGSGRRYVSFGTAFAGHAETSWPIDALYDGPYTVFVVAGRQSGQTLRFATGTGSACSGDCRNTELAIGYRDGTRYTFDQHANGLDVPIAAYPGSGLQVHRAVARFDDARGHSLRVTDAAGGVQSAANANLEPLRRPLIPNLRVGRSSWQAEAMNGGVAELIVYTAPLSDAEVAVVEEYLRRKWRF